MIEYSVENLSCGHCVVTVTRALRQLNPTAAIRVDLARQRVWVAADVPPADVARRLADAGYPAKPVAAE
jgi:copper chaperone